MILQKHIVPGQWINSGEVLFRLASSQSMDVEAELSSDQWQRIAVNVVSFADDTTQIERESTAFKRKKLVARIMGEWKEDGGEWRGDDDVDKVGRELR